MLLFIIVSVLAVFTLIFPDLMPLFVLIAYGAFAVLIAAFFMAM